MLPAACRTRRAGLAVAAMQLTDKVAVVTGANRGIGLEVRLVACAPLPAPACPRLHGVCRPACACAPPNAAPPLVFPVQLVRQLLAKGNTVIATARKPADAGELQGLWAGAGSRLHVTELDVAAPESVESWAAGVRALAPHVDVSWRGGCRAAGRPGSLRRVLCPLLHGSGAGAPSAPAGQLFCAWPEPQGRSAVHLTSACQRRPRHPPRPPVCPCCARQQLLVNNAGVTDGWKELGEVTARDMLDCFTPNCIGGGRLPATGSLQCRARMPRARGSAAASFACQSASRLSHKAKLVKLCLPGAGLVLVFMPTTTCKAACCPCLAQPVQGPCWSRSSYTGRACLAAGAAAAAWWPTCLQRLAAEGVVGRLGGRVGG